MIYLQLSQPYRDYNKVRIASFTVEATKIAFQYQIYKDGATLSDKYLLITEEAAVNSVKAVQYPNTTAYDAICKALIQYLIDEHVEAGTIEVA
jgi:hypothetical protein